MSLTLEEARARRVCRVCGGPIEVGVQPAGWKDDYGAMVWPVALTLDFGREFAHTGCLAPTPIEAAAGPDGAVVDR